MKPEEIKAAWQLRGIDSIIGGRVFTNDWESVFGMASVSVSRINPKFNSISFTIEHCDQAASFQLDKFTELDFNEVMRKIFLFNYENKWRYWGYHNALHCAIQKYGDEILAKSIRDFLDCKGVNCILNGVSVDVHVLFEAIYKVFCKEKPEKLIEAVLFEQDAVGFDAKGIIRNVVSFLKSLPGAQIPPCPTDIVKWLSWE